MPDILKDPVRKIALPFAGDPWAQPGAQVPIPDDVQRLTITGLPLRIRVVGYTGVGPGAMVVDLADASFSFTVVTLRSDAAGNVTLARTKVVTSGAGEKQITEDDVSLGSTVCLGLPTVMSVTTPALRVFVDSGAKYTAGSNGQA